MTLSIDSLILGLTTGLTYALLAAGLVLIYKSSRFINFAHGQLGAFSAMLVAKLANDHGFNYWLAFALALGVAVVVAGAVELTVIRRLFNAPRVVLMVASIGVAQLLYAASFIKWFRPEPIRLVREGYPTPFDVKVDVFGFVLQGREFMILLFAPLAGLAIAYLLRATHTGVRIQAVASNDEAARLAGIPVRRVSTTVWVVAGLLAALTAILLGPGRGSVNTEVLGPALMARALIAALVGRMVSLLVAFGAGVAVGVVEQVSLANFGGGTTELLLYVAMLGILLWRANGLARQHRGAEEARPFAARPRPIPPGLDRAQFLALLRGGGAILAIGVALLLPVLPGLDSQGQALLLAQTCVYAILGVSLFVLVNWCGQISLGHFAFVGVGAFTAARMSEAGYSVPFVLIVGGALGALVAIVVGLPAARVSGLFLGVSTLGFAVVAPGWLFQHPWLTDGHTRVSEARIPLIGTVSSPRGLYYVGLVILVVTLVAVTVMRRTVARRLIAVRDNPRAASAHGLPPVAVNVSGFAISGFIAGVAGVLWGYVNVHFDATAFNPSLSLGLLAMVVVGGLSSPIGAVLGAVTVIGIPTLLHLSPTFIFATSGAGLIAVLMQLPGGMLTQGYQARDALLRLFSAVASRSTFTESEHETETADAPALDCRGLRVTFGGLVALDDVSLRVEAREIVGLIGANGAGKTTLMNAVSGFVAADGDVELHGEAIAALSPTQRARAGLGRSFQGARLYPRLTVRECVQVALEARERSELIPSLLALPPSVRLERFREAAADDLLDVFGLGERAEQRCGELSTGTRRLVELACLLALEPRVVLLDEPVAGLAQREAEAFGPVLSSVRGELGAAMLVIEHDLPLVMEISDRLYCLESGAVIAQGAPEDVRNNPRVVASYLGTDERAIRRSGTRRKITAGTGGGR